MDVTFQEYQDESDFAAKVPEPAPANQANPNSGTTRLAAELPYAPPSLRIGRTVAEQPPR